jgi:hypothetical protein
MNARMVRIRKKNKNITARADVIAFFQGKSSNSTLHFHYPSKHKSFNLKIEAIVI